MKRLAIVCLLALWAVWGCGYGFPGEVRVRPGGVRYITIPIVKNATNHTDLTNALTNNLVQQFNLSRVAFITVPDRAEASLDVRIVSVQIEGGALTSSGQTSASRRVTVTARAVLHRIGDGEVLWQSSNIVSRQNYPASSDQGVVEANLLDAKAEAAEDIAEKIHNSMFEGF